MSVRNFAALAVLSALLLATHLATRGPLVAGVPILSTDSHQARPDDARTPAVGVFAMSSPASRNAAQSKAPPPTVAPMGRDAPPLPFTFLGALKEGGETANILCRGGRTFMVRGEGKLDDDYEIESIQEGFLVLRYVPLGALQILELAAPRHDAATHGSAEDSPQD